MKRKLTIAVATDIRDLPGVLSQAQISVDAGTALDIALNAKAVEPFVTAFDEEVQRVSDAVKEYRQEAKRLQATTSGREMGKAMQELQSRYVDALLEEDSRIEALRKQRTTKSREFELTAIKQGALAGESALLAQIFGVLLEADLLDRDSDGAGEQVEKPVSKRRGKR